MSEIDFTFDNVSLNESPSEAGVYAVEVVDCDGYITQSGNKRVSFRARVVGGPADGCTIKDGINLPTRESQGVKKVWLGFFKSLGISPAEVVEVFSTMANKGDEDAKFYADEIGKTVVGLTGYVHYKPAVEEGSWPQRKWITPHQAKAQLNRSSAPSGGSDLTDFITIDD